MLFLPAFKLKTRMMLILGVMGLLQTGLIGVFAVHYLSVSLEEQIGQRALHVAKSVAIMPEVIQAVNESDSTTLQPIALALAETIEARYVVIGDRYAKRLAHPNPAMLGLSMEDDDDDDATPTLIHGRAVLTKAEGSLGFTMRARAPIFDITGEDVIGLVSVGYLLDDVAELIDRYRLTLLIVILLAFASSVVTAVWFANHFKRSIFGLEPEQIARLFEERNATLESVREGIIAINRESKITTINRAAIKTLELPDSPSPIGEHIQRVLPDSAMQEVLETGIPHFDHEVWLNNMNLIVNRVPIMDGEKVTGVVSSFRRKDELVQVSKQLTRIQQYADTLRSQSHEYSNKLHTIAGLIQIGASEQALAVIGQETQGHQNLIKLLLDAVPDPILAGCLLGKYNRAREMGLELVIDPESQMMDIPRTLPREQLVSIVGNLIDNALEATLAYRSSTIGAYKSGEVRLSMTDLGDDLIFEFEDQGKGVATNDQERIFEKGVTSKVNQGHGLGLYLVRSILTHLGGTITVESLQPIGSRFTVYIPKSHSS